MNDSESLEKIRGRASYYPSMVPAVPARYRRLMDGLTVSIGDRGWRCISGYGHAPEHIALYSDELQVLISGDMVLPRISTNVSVLPIEPDSTPVQDYLASLEKLEALPEDVVVLPSHGKPFRGLHVRIAQQREHHRARLSEVHAACDTPQSAADIVPRMFRRPLDAHQLHFALGEALAHLQQLWHEGSLVRATGPDGIVRFEKCRSASPS
jgi:glyoxylase-like metal-dependent hydrolase (beta-lactamase superfamily II)